jgi:hypothetical protein
MTGALRTLVVRVARLALPEMHLFGMTINPDTGVMVRGGRGMLDELATDSGSELREELMLDEPVLRSFARRFALLGYATNTEFDLLWADMGRWLFIFTLFFSFSFGCIFFFPSF